MDGLDVVAKTRIKRSILVSSHHNNEGVRKKAMTLNTKILPKQLAAEVSITLSAPVKSKRASTSKIIVSEKLKKVDLVFADDDKLLVEILVTYLLGGKKVDVYHSIKALLKSAKGYAKDTKFLIDNQFKGETLRGIDVCTKLFKLGYNNLYLFSGTDLSNDPSVPDFIHHIEKSDTDAVKNLVRKNTS